MDLEVLHLTTVVLVLVDRVCRMLYDLEELLLLLFLVDPLLDLDPL